MPLTLSPGVNYQLNVPLTPILPETARLYGDVTDANSGYAIAGALVALSGPYTYSAYTDNDGHYDIGDIVPGTYTVVVSADGYEPMTY